MTEQDLLRLKKKVDDAKSSVSELGGQLKEKVKQLNEDFQCDTVEAGQKKLNETDTKIDSINTEIDKGLKELEQEYK